MGTMAMGKGIIMANKKVEGIIAEFKNPAELIHAAEKLRDSEYKKFDCHSPFPIHGMDRAMGEKRSPLGWIVGIVAFLGLGGGVLLEWWTSTIDYPLVISGKPFFSYQAYGPVAFAVMVLSSSFIALLGMLILNKLPRLNHPVFNSDRFLKVSDDAFFVSIESLDPHFDQIKTSDFLKSIGGQNIELLETDEKDK
jgi:hypothetical protein